MGRPLLTDLPEVLRDDPAMRDLLRAFERLLLGDNEDESTDDVTAVLGANPLGLEHILDDLPRYFSAGTNAVDGAPDEFLPWLGQWVAMSLRTDITFGARKNVAKENALRRRFIARMAQIYRHRGTRRSMEELLEIFTLAKVTVDDPLGEVTVEDQIDAEPHHFRVLIRLGAVQSPELRAEYDHFRGLALSVIDLEKPAHTRYSLVVATTAMQIGQRSEPPPAPAGTHVPTEYHIRVGHNTRLGFRPGRTN